jgi:putative salt-induced outer membrane protein YdiY
MLEYESLNLPEDAQHPPILFNHRWTNTLVLGFQLAPHVTLANTIYVQPRFDDFTDLRILDEADLAVGIGDHLAVVTAFSFRYDSRPPDGLKNTDISVSQSLRMRF